LADLRAAFAAGWRDFLAFPAYGLFFASIYVITGLGLYFALYQWGAGSWPLALAAGFPMVAPFTAVGLYEVSRRREAGLPLGWRVILGSLRGRGDEQVMSMGVILFVAFGFWLMIAHGIFAVFLASSSSGSESLEFLFTEAGISMLLVGSVVGGAIALALFSITVVSLPMLVDRDVDFITAIITSCKVMRANGKTMLFWACSIALLLFIAMAPYFLGLLVVLPVLGHASWHLYRRAVPKS
jgi:uncharacterized membrane protein